AATPGGFPPAIYPPPVHSRGALPACPNPAGLEPINRELTSAAVASARRYDHTSQALDLRASDRAWWPQVRSMWHAGRPQLGHEIVDGSEPLGRSAYSTIVRSSCGSSLVSRSTIVVVGPPHARCAACRTHLFFLGRRGRALLYYLY
ncbi:MAG: hypothetical protein ACRDLP_04105, partial [Solirubrobacteraceae bacterium]